MALAGYHLAVAWYREWFGEAYLDLYAHRDRDEAERHVAFVERVLGGPPRGRVLDLASGAGRHTEALGSRGWKAVGVDLSLTLLAQCPELTRACGDMRCLPFAAGSFAWVLNFFTSFGYFEGERENFLVLEEVARVLSPGGFLILDLLNPEPTIAGLNPRECRQLEDRRVEIERWYDAGRRRINKRIHLIRADGSRQTFLESVRAYRHDEVGNGLSWAGLEHRATYGDFEGGVFNGASERMILVASKT